MFIPSTFKRPVSSWKALNLRKTLLMASSVRLKPLNCSRLPCVYAQERSEERFSRNAETDLVCRLLLEKKKKLMDRTPQGKSCDGLSRACRALSAHRLVTVPARSRGSSASHYA